VKTPRPLLLLALSLALVLGITACSEMTASPTGGAPTVGAESPPTTAAAAGAEGTTTGAVSEAATAAPLTTPGAWTELHPAGDLPSARFDPSMVFELYGGGVFVFGGCTGGPTGVYLNDTWGYDPVANVWTSLGSTGDAPSVRIGSAMAYGSGSGQVILFGGDNGNAYFYDTWAYDRKADVWVLPGLVGEQPLGRSSCLMTYDSRNDRIILFGGLSWDTGYINETWAYDPGANTWTNLNPSGSLPPPRGQGGMVYDSRSGLVILFGGSNHDAWFNDTWTYDPAANTWTELSPTGDLPTARHRFGLAYDSGKDRVVLFGGTDVDRNFYNDTWIYDPNANTWTELIQSGAGPGARTGTAMVYDSLSGDLILFGGLGGGSSLNDLWAYRLP